MITDDDCEQSLNFLSGSCDEIASRKAEQERADILRKRIRRKWFLTFDGSNDVRNAHVEAVEEVQKADDRWIAAVEQFESLRAQRDLHIIRLDVYRTQAASRRAGL